METYKLVYMENWTASREPHLAVLPEKILTGLYFDMPRECYDRIPAANQSTLKAMLKESPAHARASILVRVEKEAWTFGTAFDRLVTLGEDFKWEDHYAIWNEPAKTGGGLAPRRGKVWDEFEMVAVADDKAVLRPQDVEALELMLVSLHEFKTASAQFTRGGDLQVCLVWKDERTGVLMKALLDKVVMDDMPTIDDIKTMVSVAPGDAEKAIVTFGYDFQGATYIRGCVALGAPAPNFLLTCVEKEARIVNSKDELRHAVRVLEMDGPTLLRGNLLLDSALDLWLACKTSKRWDAYPDRIDSVSAPLWALREVGVE